MVLTVRVIQNGKVELPNLSDAAPTLDKSNLPVDAKCQSVEKKVLARCFPRVPWVIYIPRYCVLKDFNTQFSYQNTVLKMRQSHAIKGTGTINSTFTFRIMRTVRRSKGRHLFYALLTAIAVHVETWYRLDTSAASG